jgi:hypothetical protein
MKRIIHNDRPTAYVKELQKQFSGSLLPSPKLAKILFDDLEIEDDDEIEMRMYANSDMVTIYL